MKAILKKSIEGFTMFEVGQEFEVTNMGDEVVLIECSMGRGGISRGEFNDYFDLVVEDGEDANN